VRVFLRTGASCRNPEPRFLRRMISRGVSARVLRTGASCRNPEPRFFQRRTSERFRSHPCPKCGPSSSRVPTPPDGMQKDGLTVFPFS